MITNCPKCSEEFENKTKWGTKKFCSRSCANSRKRPDSVKQKIRNSVKNHYQENGVTPTRERLSPEEYDQYLEKQRKSRNKRLLETPFEQVSKYSIRKRIMLEQKGHCNKCGLNEWQGEPIALELEHKDGDNQNNSRENLECLCPNCHATTDTWRGRNLGKKKAKKVSREELVRAYLEEGNIRRALLKCKLTAKGGNYATMKRYLDDEGIDY